jgi:hypothetical protein
MLATINRTNAIAGLNIEHVEVRALIEALSDDEKMRPNTIEYGLYPDQELSFKDLLAHLITYEAFTLEALDAWQRGEAHPAIAASLSDEGSREMHYGGIAARRSHTLAQVLDEWERTQSRLMEALNELTDHDWHTPAPFVTAEPMNLGGMVEIILVAPPRPPYRHLPVHIPDADAYLRKLRAK